ncbi:MAG TPA: ATP-binding protein [Chthoniobacterales bacterium]|nr:ATP-binding protein [Chthoniobacterales bacterium]
MKAWLRDLPIKRKLILVILLTSTFALWLMGTALITYEFVTFRRSLAVNMSVLARIIGSNSTAALAFDDAPGANEILGALAAEHQVTAAAVYDQKGSLFARFPETLSETSVPEHPGADGEKFDRKHLVMFQPILQGDTRLGTIYLQADLGEMYARFRVYGTLLLIVSIFAFLGALALSARLQRRISEPILDLANLATAVSERQDYSVRGTRQGADEIGHLTEAFNHMLARIGESRGALQASEERLRLALEGSQMGTWDWNLVTNRVSWDDHMYPLFHRNKNQFDGTMKSVMDVIHPDDRDELREVLRKAVDDKRDLDIAFRIVDPDGSVRHMASRGRVFYDREGKPTRMSGVSMDVTKSKQIEQALQDAKDAAEAANKEKDHFLAIVSHELRTPLTPVLATVAMLENDKDVPVEVQQELQMIRRNIEVEARLIDDLLDINRIARGKLDLHRQVVDVRVLLEHALQNYCAGPAAKKGISVSIDIQARETHVFVDSSRMTQVFWNVLQNACKFTPQGGTIHVRARNDFRHVDLTKDVLPSGDDPPMADLVVEIVDSGMGISPETLPRIFNAFEQGERSRGRSFGGLGLGLAISRAIMELHGGTISATSEGKNKGSTFTIRLHTVQAIAPVDGENGVHLTPERVQPLRPLRVLVVEDHMDTAEQFARLLQRAGHEVICAANIKQAQMYAMMTPDPHRTCAFDILISDLDLPDGSGRELMRNLSQRCSIRGIAVSGHGSSEDINSSIAAGFSHHITKPVNWGELQRAIQEIAAANLRTEMERGKTSTGSLDPTASESSS